MQKMACGSYLSVDTGGKLSMNVSTTRSVMVLIDPIVVPNLAFQDRVNPFPYLQSISESPGKLRSPKAI